MWREPLLDLLVATTKKMRVGDGLQSGVEMGPVVTDEHRKKIVGYIEKGVAEGAKPLCDGREAANCEGYFVGPTIFDHVTPEMTIAKEEIFGPVLSVIRVKTLDEAIESGEQLEVRQHDFDFHERREVGERICVANRVRDGGSEHRRRRADGVFPVFRLEEFVFRRSARAWKGCGCVLHGTESNHDAMVLILIVLLSFQQPAFEVASVKPITPENRLINNMGTYPGGRIMCDGCWLSYLIMEAFDVRMFQVAGGPQWMREERFNVEARPPAGTLASRAHPPLSKLPMIEEQRQMLQALLAERFQLKYHREQREGTVYFLVKTNKRLKLDPAKDKDAYPWAGAAKGGGFGATGIAGTNITMAQFASRLSQALDRPV